MNIFLLNTLNTSSYFGRLVKRKQFVEDCVGETDAFKVLIYHQDNSSSSSVRRKHQLEWNLLGSLEFIAIVTSDLNNFPISNTQDTEQSLSEPFTEEIDQALSDKAKKEEEKKTTGVMFVNRILEFFFAVKS